MPFVHLLIQQKISFGDKNFVVELLLYDEFSENFLPDNTVIYYLKLNCEWQHKTMLKPLLV